MRLYRIPWPWDYHAQGAIFVMAKNQEAALKKGQAFYENMEDYRTRWQSLKPEWDQIEFVKGGVAEDRGCDC